MNLNFIFEFIFLFQAAVLCVFNNAERLTFNEIIEQVKLDHEDLARVLHSLSCADYKILKKEPASKTISKTDSFEFNSKFTNKKQRIKVCMIKSIVLFSCY